MVTVVSSSSKQAPVFLKSKRCDSSRLAWSTALVSSCESISDTTSKEGMELTIPAGLQGEQPGVAPVDRHQCLVAAALHDAAGLEHQNLIRHAHRGKAVRYDDGDAVLRQFPEMLEDLG